MPCAATFLKSLRSTVVTRFNATTDALTPVGRRFGPPGHEHRLSPAGLPDYCGRTAGHSVSNPQRTDRGAPGCPRIYARADRLRLSLAGSPSHADRIEFTVTAPHGRPVLRTGRSRSVALHPGLLRRSYGSIPHGSSPHRSGLPPPDSPALSGARARRSRRFLSAGKNKPQVG